MHKLAVVEPFDFNLSLAFLNGFPPMQGEQGLQHELRKATRLNGQTVGFVVKQAKDRLTCTLYPEKPLAPDEETALLERISFFLALDVDLKPFYALARQDKPFAPVLNALHGFHQPRFLTPFEVACWAVIHQRMPLAHARKVKQAIYTQYGGHWAGLPAFPEPRDLAHLTEADFLKLVANERKARALKEITAAFQGVTTQELVNKPYDEVLGWLRGIYGIGEWSALFILVRGLGRIQNIVVQDRESAFLKEMQKAARPVYGDLTPEQLWEKAEQYGDQQGQWAIHLRSRSALQGENKMNVTLNYISFVVSDMQKSLAFYRTLGLPIPENTDASQDHVEITVNGLRIAWEKQEMIQGLNPDWTPSSGPGRVGVALEASSPAEVDAAVQRVKAAGYAVKTEPWDAFWGQRYATVLDPDGTSIDVFAWLK